ncbi:fungal-specific transcription factor domain-containing protein [Truncatella angustata]|uniref:Fungal-specific transcription factor domain-containing protein n=1 Tax=Truncatella angustata TaxID=152316 RepID=A0A9P8ZYA8_9PEZI|nr:fungal-specific transcription factor domain-containing protein [Truncatella angustata]KAH6653841.1 fungal-specific transcription factor domain-containing protein [Truncatella angustata]
MNTPVRPSAATHRYAAQHIFNMIYPLCNGQRPCNTCIKRQLACVYTPAPVNLEPDESPVGSPAKRRNVDTSPTAFKLEMSKPRRQSSVHIPALSSWDIAETSAMGMTKSDISHTPGIKFHMSPSLSAANGELDQDSRSRMSTINSTADEADLYPSQRMLQDSTGRLLYVGDSATLSYLQLIRIIVDGIAGESRFTKDPKRHMIMEARIDPPPCNTPPGVLPDRRTADVLVESYFVNTSGLIEVFDRRTFLDQLNQCYFDPLTVDPAVICQLNLVFAIGLVLSKPVIGSEEEAIIQKVRENKTVNRAEVFFRNAKGLADPISGFEDADFWSVQALVLMVIYMLSVSKRNAAYAYYGMAVRSAFALGLHREEDSVIFTPMQRKVRRNLWRSLYVLDRFLSASLGRPTAISDEDCSDHAFDATEKTFETEVEETNSAALDAAVRSCRVIGLTLKRVYSQRKISTAVAQDIAVELDDWNKLLHQSLHWKQAKNKSMGVSHGIAILHINLLQCHSIILLARPFFLFILKAGIEHKPSRLSQRMESFAQTCVEAAQHTIAVAKTALEGNYLSQCDPFVIYFVFAAGLITLSNEFASLYRNPDADKAIQSCVEILRYCAERDAQAQRVVYIVEAFHEANLNRPANARSISFLKRRVPTIIPVSSNHQHDPMAHFFAYTKSSPGQQLPALAPSRKHGRSSIPTFHPGSVPPVFPRILQQPSPDATGASPVSAAVMPPGMQPIESMPGVDMGFDFDDLWPTWHHPGGTMPIGHHVEPAESYGHYTLGPALPGLENTLAANVNIPLYPASDFR